MAGSRRKGGKCKLENGWWHACCPGMRSSRSRRRNCLSKSRSLAAQSIHPNSACMAVSGARPAFRSSAMRRSFSQDEVSAIWAACAARFPVQRVGIDISDILKRPRGALTLKAIPNAAQSKVCVRNVSPATDLRRMLAGGTRAWISGGSLWREVCTSLPSRRCLDISSRRCGSGLQKKLRTSRSSEIELQKNVVSDQFYSRAYCSELFSQDTAQKGRAGADNAREEHN